MLEQVCQGCNMCTDGIAWLRSKRKHKTLSHLHVSHLHWRQSNINIPWDLGHLLSVENCRSWQWCHSFSPKKSIKCQQLSFCLTIASAFHWHVIFCVLLYRVYADIYKRYICYVTDSYVAVENYKTKHSSFSNAVDLNISIIVMKQHMIIIK